MGCAERGSLRASRLAPGIIFGRSRGICLDPPPGGSAEPITLRDKPTCVWKQLLAALS